MNGWLQKAKDYIAGENQKPLSDRQRRFGRLLKRLVLWYFVLTLGGLVVFTAVPMAKHYGSWLVVLYIAVIGVNLYILWAGKDGE